jgi:hypothetical protein
MAAPTVRRVRRNAPSAAQRRDRRSDGRWTRNGRRDRRIGLDTPAKARTSMSGPMSWMNTISATLHILTGQDLF